MLKTIFWANPHTQPPNGLPRKLWQGDPNSRFVDAFFEVVGLGQGYSTGYILPEKPRKKWSREAKARNRRKRLRKRLEKKFPLLAELLYFQEIEARQDYFDAIDPPYVPPQQRPAHTPEPKRKTAPKIVPEPESEPTEEQLYFEIFYVDYYKQRGEPLPNTHWKLKGEPIGVFQELQP